MTRNAPAGLRYALVRPPAALGAGLMALAALSAAGLLLWTLRGMGGGWLPAALGLGLWLAVGAGAWQVWRHWPEGWLQWDGREWWLHTGVAPALLRAAPQVCWDGQDWLLLQVLPAGGRRHWLWLAGASAPALWGDLRRAVYWRARPAASA